MGLDFDSMVANHSLSNVEKEVAAAKAKNKPSPKRPVDDNKILIKVQCKRNGFAKEFYFLPSTTLQNVVDETAAVLGVNTDNPIRFIIAGATVSDLKTTLSQLSVVKGDTFNIVDSGCVG